MDHLQTRGRQLGGPQLHLPFQLVGMRAEVVLVGFDRQDVAHSRHQVEGIDGLGEEIGGAQFQGRRLHLAVVDRGENDDGDAGEAGTGADRFQDLQPIDARQHDVQQQQVGILLLDGRHDLAGLAGGGHVGEPGVLEVLPDGHDVDRFIVNDHDFRAGVVAARRVRRLRRRIALDRGHPISSRSTPHFSTVKSIMVSAGGVEAGGLHNGKPDRAVRNRPIVPDAPSGMPGGGAGKGVSPAESFRGLSAWYISQTALLPKHRGAAAVGLCAGGEAGSVPGPAAAANLPPRAAHTRPLPCPRQPCRSTSFSRLSWRPSGWRPAGGCGAGPPASGLTAKRENVTPAKSWSACRSWPRTLPAMSARIAAGWKRSTRS